MKTYESIEAFYSENEERRRSGEADYGVHWTEPGKRWPAWRVSYVHKTGEVYALELGGGRVEVLGIVPPDDDPHYYYLTLNKILEDWENVIWEEGSLTWVREKLEVR